MENQGQPDKKDGYIRCYMCGHIDNFEYCSNCGHPLRNPEEKVGVLIFLMEIIRDIIAPVATGLTTFCLFLFRPQSAYEAIFNGTETNSTSTTVEKIRLPLITNFWEKTLGKKQKIFEPSGYLIFTTIIYMYIYNNLSPSQLTLFDDVPPLLKGAFQEVESILAFIVILLTCMFFAVLSKIIFNQTTWSNSYALSIYLLGTNSLIISFWRASFQLFENTFSESPVLLLLFVPASIFIFLIILLTHSIISPIRFLPKAMKIPLPRLLTLLFLGYTSFPFILIASLILLFYTVGLPSILIIEAAKINIYTQVCCAVFFIFLFVFMSFLIRLFRRSPNLETQS